jgi:hypothetical protein
MVLALDGLGGHVPDLDLASFNEDVVDAIDLTAPAEVLGFRGRARADKRMGVTIASFMLNVSFRVKNLGFCRLIIRTSCRIR